MKFILIAVAVYFALLAPANAYIGPGMGAGAVAVVVGIVGAIFLAIFAVLFYPIRRLLKKLKAPKTEEAEKTTKQ